MKESFLGISKTLAYVFHPIFIPLHSIVLFYFFSPEPFFFTYFDPKLRWALALVIILYSCIFPLLLVFVLRKMGQISSIVNMSVTDRNKLLVLISGIYAALAYFLYTKGNLLRPLSFVFMIYVVNLLGNLVANFFMKISLHISAISCVLGISFYLMSFYGIYSLRNIVLVLIFLAGLLGSTRLFLNAHKPKEVYLAYFWGLFSGIFSAFILF